MSTTYLYHNKKVLKPVETDLYSGWTEAPEIQVSEALPNYVWKGAKIPFQTWSEIVAFMRWSQATHKEEAMLFLFYKPDTRQWAAWVFPQEPNGMTVKMLPEHPLYTTDREQFGRGWIQAGTVHHHCTTGAFQSGTDRTDEEDRDGLHVTLGNMDKRTLDIDCRQVFDGVQSKCTLFTWIEYPEYLTEIPQDYIYDFAFHIFASDNGKTFPEEWKARILKNYRSSFPQGQAGALTQHLGLTKKERKKLRKTGTLLTPSDVTAGRKTTTEEQQNLTWPESYNQRNRHLVTVVLTRLSISLEEGCRLMDGYPKATLFTTEDLALRNILVRELLKEGLQPFVAEDLMNLMLETEGAVTPTGT